jgi:hypothetical protein
MSQQSQHPASAPASPHPGPATPRKVIVAGLVGTSLEWYDFFLYTTASAVVFSKLFFPRFDPLTGTMPPC